MAQSELLSLVAADFNVGALEVALFWLSDFVIVL
jgi:hypothetical protein